MQRTNQQASNCSIARSLQVVGDKWTLLIIRESFYGATRYEQFHQVLKCPRNLLSQRLARLCGKGVAHELCLTGEMITAEEAHRIGLVNHVHEPAELIPAAEAMAKKIIANGPLAVKFTMEAIERGVEMAQEEGLFLEATLFGVACATEDMREGTKAFLEKRAPQFKGK